MGVFDAMCSASGIVLEGRTRLMFVVEETGGLVAPLLVPLRGVYDRYGRIENIAPGPELDAAQVMVERAGLGELEHLLDQAFEAGVMVEGRMLRYALIDELVYRAMVATVACGALPGTSEAVEDELRALPFRALVAAASAAPELAVAALTRWTEAPQIQDDGLCHDLVQLALFRQWPLPLRATTSDSPSDQFLFFRREVAEEHQEPAVETETRRAEEAFAGYPLVLAAIRANELAWLERERENLEEDDLA